MEASLDTLDFVGEIWSEDWGAAVVEAVLVSDGTSEVVLSLVSAVVVVASRSSADTFLSASFIFVAVSATASGSGVGASVT